MADGRTRWVKDQLEAVVAAAEIHIGTSVFTAEDGPARSFPLGSGNHDQLPNDLIGL